MDCRRVGELADSFVDGELPADAKQEVVRHVDSCPACRDDIAARRRLRERVRVAVAHAPGLDPRPEFIEALRTQLKDAADARSARGMGRPGRWWALAAAVLLAVTAGVVYRNRSAASSELARSAVGDHRNCALQFRLTERPIPLSEAARRYGAAYRIVERLPPADIRTAAGVARVLERHACVYNGRRFAHVVLEFRRQRVSLMVTADDRGTASGNAAPGSIDGMNVVSFRAGRHVVFIAGDVSLGDLAQLADTVEEPLRQELARV
jgi:anti-sigma factor RsiW